MFRWLAKPTRGFPRNDDISQYAEGTLTMAPINPVPVLSAVVERDKGTQADRYANGPPPAHRSPWGGKGIPLPPWLSQVVEAQDKARQLRFTPVPEYVKQDRREEEYRRFGNAINSRVNSNASSVNQAMVNSQTLGLGNNRR
jgi:hypothetical protein